MAVNVRGVVFDKDGTLFDFNATWGAWARGVIADEAQGDAELAARLAGVLGYDTAAGAFRPGSIVIAETTAHVAQAILPLLPGADQAGLLDRLNRMSSNVPQVEAVPLAPFMAGLRAGGLALGLVTNDAEMPARAHLARAQVDTLFDFVAGYDSGHGAKPAPGPLLAFCAATGLPPAACVMVGDSTHDLHAGRAAGMRTVGVLTGPATREVLEPVADAVLPSIAGLPALLAAWKAD
ncbi:MAG: HAD-IA family hydrolase [Limimaricola sp.]|uniref:HAD family hydrolase n=1 Tax=Limimaricola sp. TaxID=2211665 RepID=UPI001D209EA7|nr:HAD family hydrolase [Limimaricola sp.]MBI1416277.1 HAD-IA family hydrolase [Limimaricola sp.]